MPTVMRRCLHYRNAGVEKRCWPRRGVDLAARLPLALLLAALTGCGMADYEKLLKAEHQKVKQIDEEKKHLGDPLEIPNPPLNDNGSPPDNSLGDMNLFLRPPKVFGCSTTSVGVVGYGKSTALYGYSGVKDHNLLLAGSVGEKPEGEFRDDVWQAFHTYLTKNRGLAREQWPAEPKKKQHERKQPLPVGKDTPPPLELDVWTWDEPEPTAEGKKDPKAVDKDKKREPARYWLYFYKSGTFQVAAIYQVPQARAGDLPMLRGMDASIKSLAVGADGGKQRLAFARWKS
jgi:hypothetical protein